MKIYRLKNGAMEEAEFYEEGTEEYVKYRDNEVMRRGLALAYHRRYKRKVREYLNSLSEEQRSILFLLKENQRLQSVINWQDLVIKKLEHLAKGVVSEEQILKALL